MDIHGSHSYEYLTAIACYYFAFPLEQAKQLHYQWILQVVCFNLCCELLFYGCWHWLLYSDHGLAQKSSEMQKRKFNPENQYKIQDQNNLLREIKYNTGGWLISSGYQCFIMYLLANGKISYYKNFWFMHPWGWELPIIGDFGQIMYNKVHSLHHKSYNIGVWSGISMHPVEHLIYYSCLILCFFVTQHPIHILYNKFNADISPIGSHDGFADPAGNNGFHYLHHTKFECNFGGDNINFDQFFGTYIEWDEYQKAVQNNQNKDVSLKSIFEQKNKQKQK